MRINLTELFSVDGKEKSYKVNIEMDSFQAFGDTCEVISKEPVTLHIQNVGSGKLLMEGKTFITLSIPCSRCLEPVDVPVELEISQELDIRQAGEEDTENMEEQPYLDGYYLDVDQLIGNELLLNLPMKVLCKDDCRGICNQCGINLNQGTCSCERGSPDPRMSIIQDIFQQFKEV